MVWISVPSADAVIADLDAGSNLAREDALDMIGKRCWAIGACLDYHQRVIRWTRSDGYGVLKTQCRGSINAAVISWRLTLADADRLLENIDWLTITHAYGPASDTPTHLRNLKSSRKSKAALGELFSSINHQGDHSDAGLYSAPCLLQLIDNPKLPNLAIVLDLILGIAVGNPDDFLLMGEKIGDSLKRTRDHAKQNPHLGWKLHNQCHQAVRQGIPQFKKLLEHNNKTVSWQSAYNLSWFPHAGATTIPEISQHFEQHKNSPEHFANYLLPLGLLQWHCNKKRGNYKSVAEYLGDSNKLIRYSSAIYCSWFKFDDEVNCILSDIATDNDFDGGRDNPYKIVFCRGNLMQYAEELLKRQSAS